MEPIEASGRVVQPDGWYGVDFDGVLAWYHPSHFPNLGAPIEPMVKQVRAWLELGIDVRVFTARVSVIEGERGEMNTASTVEFAEDQRRQIEDWCVAHIGQKLPVTCIKDFKMLRLFDDRCVQMVPNTGESLQDRIANGLREIMEPILP